MKNRILALLVPLFCLVTSAFAGPLAPKNVPLLWVRDSVAVKSPFFVSLSDGNHPLSSGIVTSPSAPQDTSQAIDVRDHWCGVRRALTVGPNGGVAASLIQDTSGVFGTLTLRSTRGITDSLTVFRDQSSDGYIWATVDSIAAHVIADTTFNKSSAISDSIQCFLGVPAILGADGIAHRVISISWPVNPNTGPGSITAMAGYGFNFVRFRIHMTPGDYSAAGTSDGWSGYFTYLGVDPNYNK